MGYYLESIDSFIIILVIDLNMFLYSTEMNVQLMEVLKQDAEGCAFGHLGKGVNILGEAFATIAELAIGAGNIGVGIVDIAREKHTSMYLTPVTSHLLAVFAAGVEIGNLIGTEDIMHVLGELGL